MKNKFNIIKWAVLFLLAGVIFHSCTDESICRKSRDVEVGMSFYVDSINPATGRWAQKKVRITPVSAHGIGIDSLLLNNAEVGNLKAPLNQFAETSQFRLLVGDIADTITVNYKSGIELLSFECGAVRVHTIESVKTSGHFFDSITLYEPNVNTLHVENIKLNHIIK